jgi:molybdopterin molybdotransferase
MITVDEALNKVLSYVEILDPERKPILDCLGQTLAEDVCSTLDIPPFDNSAMDGYALRAEDTAGADASSPRYLRVVGELAAGAVPTQAVGPGTAIRIMTGAPVPEGADVVVRFEDTDEVDRRPSGADLTQIGIMREAGRGLNIRRRGEDIPRGDVVLNRGTLLRPQEIGVLASLGHATALVIRRPIVAILSTGDELVAVEQPLTPGKIYDSNTYTIAAEVSRYGGIPRILGIGRDSVQSLTEKLDQALAADMLITSGGVSKGDYDMVKDVLAQRGEIGFWTVSMKPGKPLAFGVIKQMGSAGEKRVPHLGLPGNPVSSMITFEQFARPAILKMMGRTTFAKPTIRAVMQDHVKNTDGRRVFARVDVTRCGHRYLASLAGPQGSGILTSMVRAKGLAVVPEDCPGIRPGDTVDVQMLDWIEDQCDLNPTPVVSIVGKSQSGKTTLMEQLIAEFKRRECRVAALKHSRGDMDIDRPGKDTWRFAQAGSDAVVISSPDRLALMRRLDRNLDVEDIIPLLGAHFDLILVEGFRKSNLPKIEVHRKELGDDLACRSDELSAVVSDGPVNTSVAHFASDDIVGIANFIDENFMSEHGRKSSGSAEGGS